MGYKIGVPSLKLNNSGTRSKHCGSFGGVAYEALEERQGLDQDIDHALSTQNIYTGYQSAAELMEYSAKHLQEMKDASGRRIRSDAVVMCATIFKPPAVYMNSLPVESQKKLLGDCLEFLGERIGKNNIKSTAMHFDEKGAHLHVFWEPMTQDGRLCAKELHNIKLFGHINENLPAYLRGRGWDIDNADCYDRAQRERKEMEAEEERYQKRQKQGRSSAAYKLDAEKQRQELLLENARAADELAVTQQKAEQAADELVELCQIKNMAERDQVAADAMAQIGELQSAIELADNFVMDAKDELEQGGLLLRHLVEDFIFDWRRIRERIGELIDSIKEKIRSVGIFERVRRVRPENQIAGQLQEDLDRTLAGAGHRAGPVAPRSAPQPSRELQPSK